MSPDPTAPPLSVVDAARLVTRDDVLQALADLDADLDHDFGDSVSYDVVHEGRRYPPKAAFGLALGKYLGRASVPGDFGGVREPLCFRTLQNLGFAIERKAGPAPAEMLPADPPAGIWVEVTKIANKQGGPGWGLGECL